MIKISARFSQNAAFSAILLPRAFSFTAVWMLIFTISCGDVRADRPLEGKPIRIPLTVLQNRTFGTYRANMSLGIGNLKPLPIALDTGSTGLHVFAAANLNAPGSGVQCSQEPVSFTAGNPGRVTYSGVLCRALLHFGNYTAPAPVPIGYLTAASCTSTNPHCKIPSLHDPKAYGDVYGVFGAGITGNEAPVPNPILTLPAPYGSIYSIRLTHQGGELVLGSLEPPNTFRFPLAAGTSEGVKWTHGQACLFVNGNAGGICLAVSFDTGNGVPWIRDANTAAIPQAHGVVTPSTRIGFGPPGSAREAASVVAGTSFANTIKVEYTTEAPLTNVSIQAFFGHIVTYNNVNGTISFAPLLHLDTRSTG